jgi:hypothetical protein
MALTDTRESSINALNVGVWRMILNMSLIHCQEQVTYIACISTVVWVRTLTFWGLGTGVILHRCIPLLCVEQYNIDVQCPVHALIL